MVLEIRVLNQKPAKINFWHVICNKDFIEFRLPDIL